MYKSTLRQRRIKMLTLNEGNTYVLFSARDSMEFGTENRRTDKGGKPLTEYLLGVGNAGDGYFELPQIKVLAPQSAKHLAELTPVKLTKPNPRLYKGQNDKGSAWRALSFTAEAVEAV
jgi:hypothetical protein